MPEPSSAARNTRRELWLPASVGSTRRLSRESSTARRSWLGLVSLGLFVAGIVCSYVAITPHRVDAIKISSDSRFWKGQIMLDKTIVRRSMLVTVLFNLGMAVSANGNG